MVFAQERRDAVSAEKSGNGRGGPVLEVRSLKTQFKTQDGVVKAVDDVLVLRDAWGDARRRRRIRLRQRA